MTPSAGEIEVSIVDVGMRLAPQPRQRFERLAQAELGEADGPEPPPARGD